MSQAVYVVSAGNAIKIGVSSDPESRAKQLNTGNANDVELLETFPSLQNRGRTAREWESEIHDHLSEYALTGEWFEIEALDELHEFVGQYESDANLSGRQSHALGVALTLRDGFPENLVQIQPPAGEVVDRMPEVKILQTIVDAYDLPHTVCVGCLALTHGHRSESGVECHQCGTVMSDE